jgi:[ribosomal protein S5]-alanine N-acetyltransferase
MIVCANVSGLTSGSLPIWRRRIVVAAEVPDLTTERLVLRGPTTTDLDTWVATIWSDPDVMRFMPKSTDPPDVFANVVLGFFNELREQQRVGAWVIADRADGQFLGHAILAHREAFDEPELGYALGKAFWGRGYATEVAEAVVR